LQRDKEGEKSHPAPPPASSIDVKKFALHFYDSQSKIAIFAFCDQFPGVCFLSWNRTIAGQSGLNRQVCEVLSAGKRQMCIRGNKKDE
jgi:hypothetical protein